jgi:cytochrome P450
LSRPARFDDGVGAWVLSSHADVLAALRDPRLATAGDEPATGVHAGIAPGTDPTQAHSVDRVAAAAVREQGRFRQPEMARTAREIVAALHRESQVDLVAEFARPWALALAGAMTGVSGEALASLSGYASVVFLGAAHATSADASSEAREAVGEIAARLPSEGGALRVQLFVAVTQTLPHVLASVWLALLDDPEATRILRAADGVGADAVRELLRHAAPARAVFRQAREDVRIGEAHVRAGDAVVLRLDAANHDPARFVDPDRLDFDRTQAHLAFGHGTHACPGVPLLRTAVAVTTEALLRGTADVQPSGPVRWIDGFAIRAPAALPVRLSDRPRRADVPSPTDRPHDPADVTR